MRYISSQKKHPTHHALLPCVFAITMGCTGQLGETVITQEVTWTLVADGDGALRDPSHPEFGAYPNPRAVTQLAVKLGGNGALCASDGAQTFCGGPVQGIPYVTRARVESGQLCVRVLDLYGNEVSMRCGLSRATSTVAREASCHQATTVAGQSCQVCIDGSGSVTSNDCAGAVASTGEFAPGTTVEPGCGTVSEATALGTSLFLDAFNENLGRIGLAVRVRTPGESLLANFEQGDLGVGDSTCGDVLDYLDDEFSDDSPGTDDWVFGPEAMAECLDRGRCRVGQLVTRSMAEACAAIPVGCSVRAIEEGIIGGGGYAVQMMCDEAADGTPPGPDGSGGLEGPTGEYTASPVEQCVGSPLVLDLSGDGLALTAPSAETSFALFGDAPMSVGWVSSRDDALLAIDLNDNGKIDGGRELFGDQTGGWAADGFAALARHDDNGDGAITAADAVYDRLLLWQDDGDAETEAGELRHLAEAGIDALSLRARGADATDPSGNELGRMSDGLASDGRTVPIIDVYFAIGGERSAPRPFGMTMP